MKLLIYARCFILFLVAHLNLVVGQGSCANAASNFHLQLVTPAPTSIGCATRDSTLVACQSNPSFTLRPALPLIDSHTTYQINVNTNTNALSISCSFGATVGGSYPTYSTIPSNPNGIYTGSPTFTFSNLVPGLVATSPGSNFVSVVITSIDGSTSTTYDFIVYRPLPKISTIQAINITAGPINHPSNVNGLLKPPFDVNTLSYSLTVPFVIDSILSFSALPSDPTASINLSNNFNLPLNLVPFNPVVFNFICVAGDGLTRSMYNITFNRLPSSDSSLASITFSSIPVNPIILSPNFLSSTMAYSLRVDPSTTSINFNLLTNQTQATVSASTSTSNSQSNPSITNIPLASGSGSISLPSISGNPVAYSSSLSISIIAMDGVSNSIYSFSIFRPASANQLALDNILINPTTQLNNFLSSQYSYNLIIPYSQSSLDLILASTLLTNPSMGSISVSAQTVNNNNVILSPTVYTQTTSTSGLIINLPVGTSLVSIILNSANAGTPAVTYTISVLRQCQVVPLPAYGNFTCSDVNNAPGNVCTLSCPANNAWIVPSANTITCQSSGLWTSPIPACISVDFCNDPVQRRLIRCPNNAICFNKPNGFVCSPSFAPQYNFNSTFVFPSNYVYSSASSTNVAFFFIMGNIDTTIHYGPSTAPLAYNCVGNTEFPLLSASASNVLGVSSPGCSSNMSSTCTQHCALSPGMGRGMFLTISFCVDDSVIVPSTITYSLINGKRCFNVTSPDSFNYPDVNIRPGSLRFAGLPAPAGTVATTVYSSNNAALTGDSLQLDLINIQSDPRFLSVYLQQGLNVSTRIPASVVFPLTTTTTIVFKVGITSGMVADWGVSLHVFVDTGSTPAIPSYFVSQDFYNFANPPKINTVTGCPMNTLTSGSSLGTSNCPTDGGNGTVILTVTGAYFFSPLTVTVGNRLCSVVAGSIPMTKDSFQCLLPQGSGLNQPLSVVSQGGYAVQYLVSYAPATITSLSYLDSSCNNSYSYTSTFSTAKYSCPRSGGSLIELTGSNFGPTGASIFIGVNLCSNTVHDKLSPNKILRCYLPRGKGLNLPVSVLQQNGLLSTSSSNGNNNLANGISISYMPCLPGESESFDSTTVPSDNDLNCYACAPGKFSYGNAATCNDCSVNTYLIVNPSIPSYLWSPSNIQCAACPANAHCVKGIVFSTANFYVVADGNGVANTLPCILPGSCLDGLSCSPPSLSATYNNSYSVMSSGESFAVSQCCASDRLPASSNALCGTCANSYSPQGSSCVSCQNPQYGILFLLIAASFAWIVVLHRLAQSDEASTRIFIYYIQTMLLLVGSNSQWLQFLSFFNLNILFAVGNSSGCIIPLTPMQNLLMGILIPLGFWLVLFICALVHSFFQTILYSQKLCLNPPRWLSPFLPSALVPFKKSPYIRTFITLVLSSYNSISQTTLAALNCVSANSSTRVVASFPDVNCDSNSYTSLYFIFVLLLIFVVIGWPLTVLVSVCYWKFKKLLDDGKVVSRYGALWKLYNDKNFAYEAVVLARRVVQVSLMLFIQSRVSRYVYVSVFNLICLCVHQALYPYALLRDNLCETLSLVFICCVGILLASIDIPFTLNSSILIGILVFLPGVILCFYIVTTKVKDLSADKKNLNKLKTLEDRPTSQSPKLNENTNDLPTTAPTYSRNPSTLYTDNPVISLAASLNNTNTYSNNPNAVELATLNPSHPNPHAHPGYSNPYPHPQDPVAVDVDGLPSSTYTDGSLFNQIESGQISQPIIITKPGSEVHYQ